MNMPSTRDEIIEVATQLVMKKGFNAMSYTDISNKLNIKNAAIHYYFPTKEDLGKQLMINQQENVKALILDLNERKISELDQLKSLIDIYSGILDGQMICPIGSMGSDILTLPESIKLEVIKDYEQVLNWLTEILESGRKKEVFNFSGEAKTKAFVIFNSLISGVLVARITNSVSFKKAIDQVILELISKN